MRIGLGWAIVAVVSAGGAGFWLGGPTSPVAPQVQLMPTGEPDTEPTPAVTPPQAPSSPVRPPSIKTRKAPGLSIERVLERRIEFLQYHGAFELAHDAGREAVETWLAIAFDWPDTHASIGVSRILLSRLIMLDPQRGMALVIAQVETSPAHRRLAFDYLHEWAVAAPADALAALSTVADDELRLALARALAADPVLVGKPVLARWLADQPQHVQQAASRAQNRRESPEAVFARLLAGGATAGNSRREIASVLMRWARQDPQAAVAAVLAEATVFQQQQWLPMILSRWAADDFDGAWQQAQSLDAGNGELLGAVLNGLARSDPPRALALAEQNRQRLSANLVQGLMMSWAHGDPRSAVEHWQSRGGADKMLASGIAQGYVRHYPAEAFAWAEQVGLDSNTLANMAMVFAEEYPQRAQRYLDDVPQGAARQALLENLAAQRSRRDGREGYQWLRQYSGEPNYQKAERRVMLEWIRQDPADAAATVSSLASEKGGGVYYSSLVNNWYARDPQAIVNWVLDLPGGRQRDQALRQLIFRVARQDGAWARSLTDEIADEQLSHQVKRRLERGKSG